MTVLIACGGHDEPAALTVIDLSNPCTRLEATHVFPVRGDGSAVVADRQEGPHPTSRCSLIRPPS